MLQPARYALILALLSSMFACDIGKMTVDTTSKVLARAHPAMEQESDYLTAARALPASLKTIEAFHMVDPTNTRLKKLLAEGYCQYGSGFVEDEWEDAVARGDSEAAEEHSRRATKAFFRCMGYGLELLGADWKRSIQGEVAQTEAMTAKVGNSKRDALMWTAIGLASAINQNKDDASLIAHVPKIPLMLNRVVELDNKSNNSNKAKRALPHIALAMLHLSLPPALGGQPEEGKKHFEEADRLTDNKFLLIKVLFARNYAVMTQNRELFRSTLVTVLQTDPAIWPDQRLANEIAHRRARRYLKQEKEWF